MSDWKSAPLGETERALCELAAGLTLRQRSASPADLERLRSLGLDDRAIHDAVQVIAYFNYITRIADALGVELEPDAPRYGRSSGPSIR